ncbi:MAG: hypothetical protein R3A45_12400 [Bdellovibrionota bacterium]
MASDGAFDRFEQKMIGLGLHPKQKNNDGLTARQLRLGIAMGAFPSVDQHRREIELEETGQSEKEISEELRRKREKAQKRFFKELESQKHKQTPPVVYSGVHIDGKKLKTIGMALFDGLSGISV